MFLFFFFNDTATTEIYTLSYTTLFRSVLFRKNPSLSASKIATRDTSGISNPSDRKSTRLNSSHLVISYAVFCLKKKNTNNLLLILIHLPHQNIASQNYRHRANH